MTAEQLAILNALVTFAAENVPGGLSEDEQKVARIVGTAALIGREPTRGELTKMREYNYRTVNISHYKNIAEAANDMADRGWRVVGVVCDTRPGYTHSLMLERPVDVSHPDD